MKWKKIDENIHRYYGEKYDYAYNPKLNTLLFRQKNILSAEMYICISVKDLKTAKEIVKLIEGKNV